MTETSETSIFQKVQSIFEIQLFQPESERSILDQLSSLELVHLVTELEKAFNISISALEMNDQTFSSVQAIARFVSAKLQEDAR